MPLSISHSAVNPWAHTHRPKPITFQGRPSPQPSTSPAEEPAGPSTSEASSQSHPAETPTLTSHAHTILSMALWRAVAGHPENSDDAGTNAPAEHPQTPEIIVVVQPDQSHSVEANLTAFPPGQAVGSVDDDRDNVAQDIPFYRGLSNRSLWFFRAFGLLGGTALIVPGALMLSAANQVEQQHDSRGVWMAKFLGGGLVGAGSVIGALATVSGLSELSPALYTRIESMVRSRLRSPQPAARPQAVELPAANLNAPV